MSLTASLQTTATNATSAASPSTLLQRKCACGASNSSIGDKCEDCQSKTLQRKLSIGSSSDPLELEADRVADQVMRMHGTVLSVAPAPAQLSRKYATREDEALDRLQTPSAKLPARTNSEAPFAVREVLRAPGQPLDPGTRAFFEPRLGHNLSQVRIHTDERAARSAQLLSAAAYTAGSHIVFADSRYKPSASGRDRLLAHELAHVVQQSGSNSSNASALVVQRAPKTPPAVDPRAAPAHRDSLTKEPKSGAPIVEFSDGKHSVSWSWEVERPGTLPDAGPIREQVYWAKFEVDEHGVMTASARMVSQSGQFRAPEWTLRGKFKEAIETFRRNGIAVRAFDAEWSYMSRGEISGNLDTFFSHLKGKPGKLRDAARATPSGKVAMENGFTQVSTPDIGMEQQPHLASVRPTVRVRFALPEAKFPDGGRDVTSMSAEITKPTPASTAPKGGLPPKSQIDARAKVQAGGNAAASGAKRGVVRKLFHGAQAGMTAWEVVDFIKDPTLKGGLMLGLTGAEYLLGAPLVLPVTLELFILDRFVVPIHPRRPESAAGDPAPRVVHGYHSAEDFERIQNDFDERDWRDLQSEAEGVARDLGWRPQDHRERTARTETLQKKWQAEAQANMAETLQEALRKSQLNYPKNRWAAEWLAATAPERERDQQLYHPSLQSRAEAVALSVGWDPNSGGPLYGARGLAQRMAAAKKGSMAEKLLEALEKSQLEEPERGWAVEWLRENFPERYIPGPRPPGGSSVTVKRFR